jgi:hypothetical protein
MPPAAAKQTALVTKDELTELAEWERKYADAKKKVSAAEKELSFRRQSLAEKVLGVKSSDELKELSPKQVENRYNARLESGDWKRGLAAPAFSFVKTHQGCYPSWSALFVEAFGETRAAEIKARTPLMYSYAVEVAAS